MALALSLCLFGGIYWGVHHGSLMRDSQTFAALVLSPAARCANWVWVYCLCVVAVFGRWGTLTCSHVFGQRLTAQHLCYATGGGLCLGAVLYGFSMHQFMHLPWHWDVLFPHLMPWQHSVLMLSWVISPVIEEILCRGVIMGLLLERLDPWTVCLMSGYLWALPVYEGPGWALALCVVIGFLLSYLRLQYRSLGASICAHLALNTVLLSSIWWQHTTF